MLIFEPHRFKCCDLIKNIFFLDNGVMTSPKRRILSFVFTVLCLKKSLLIRKYLLGALFLRLLLETSDRHFTFFSEPREDLAICRVKGVSYLLSHFRTLSIRPVSEIEPTPSHSAVKRPTYLSNPCLGFY